MGGNGEVLEHRRVLCDESDAAQLFGAAGWCFIKNHQ